MPARDAFIVQLFIVPLACFGAAREKQVRRTLGTALVRSAAPRDHAAAVRYRTLQNAAERADLLAHTLRLRVVWLTPKHERSG